MKTEARFLVAIVLMVGVLVGTNLLFPPVPPDEPAEVVETGVGGPVDGADDPTDANARTASPEGDPATAAPSPVAEPADDATPPVPPTTPAIPERRINGSRPTPRLRVQQLRGGASLRVAPTVRVIRGRGPRFSCCPARGTEPWGVGSQSQADTLDFTRVPFEVTPAEGLTLVDGGGTETLRFTYEHPQGLRGFEIEYAFDSRVLCGGRHGSGNGCRPRPAPHRAGHRARLQRGPGEGGRASQSVRREPPPRRDQAAAVHPFP